MHPSETETQEVKKRLLNESVQDETKPGFANKKTLPQLQKDSVLPCIAKKKGYFPVLHEKIGVLPCIAKKLGYTHWVAKKLGYSSVLQKKKKKKKLGYSPELQQRVLPWDASEVSIFWGVIQEEGIFFLFCVLQIYQFPQTELPILEA